jgi:FkbM family methyltransferase
MEPGMSLRREIVRQVATIGQRVPSIRRLKGALKALRGAGLGASPAAELERRLDAGEDVHSLYPPAASRQDILACFRLLLGRNPNPSEWKGHAGQAGSDLTAVVKGYLGCLEFSQRKLIGGELGSVQRVSLDGFEMFVDAEDIAVGSQIAKARAYEPDVTRVIRERLRPGMSLLDIGANMGFFTLLGASVVGSQGKVFAIEPNPRNVKLLYASTETNRFSQVAIYQAAATTTWCTLALNAVHSNGAVSALDGGIADLVNRETVLGLKLDDVLHAITALDLIKIDVEGAEYVALKGAEGLLRRFHPTIVSEFAPESIPGISGVSAEAYLSFLVDLGYSLSVLTEGGLAACGRDAAKVIDRWKAENVDHIDILAEHPSRAGERTTA